MEVYFEKFRCFGERQSARIAPITLLVGENSAGKSTFLAGLRYILDFVGRHADPSFNKDPFFLGGYKSIAHYRGGRHGRASEFALGMSETFTTEKEVGRNLDMFATNQQSSRTIQFFLSFADVEGNAKPIKYDITLEDRSINISINKTNIKALVGDKVINFQHEVSRRQVPGSLVSRSDFLTLDYVLRDISFARMAPPSEASETDEKASLIAEDIWSTFRRIGSRRRSLVYALAPVRTRPLRSYDPTQLSPSSEGDQLIAQLGRMARVDPTAWDRMKSTLETYGKATGLFEAIKIQKLGQEDSDPFQIMVKASGRETNIIDVGYGVSQVLPILIMLSEPNRGYTLLIQQPEVHLHPSAQAAVGNVFVEVASKQKGSSFVIETHSDFIVDRIRMGVRNKQLKPRDVQILFFRKDKHNSVITSIEVDDNGDMINAPEAYRDFFLKESISVMGF